MPRRKVTETTEEKKTTVTRKRTPKKATTAKKEKPATTRKGRSTKAEKEKKKEESARILHQKPSEEDGKKMTPSEYFSYVKEKKNHIDEEDLRQIYENALNMINRYEVTGQTRSIEKLKFLLDIIELEIPIVKAGYNQFVYRWDVEEYIDKISDDSVFIIEMKNYEREFPDEVIDKIVKAKEVFGDNLYVIYTDYTKKTQRKVAKERRERDPILFGALVKNRVAYDRFYYICDWEDEYCDLTLDKLVNDWDKFHADDEESSSLVHKTIEHGLSIEEMKKMVQSSTENPTDAIITEGDNDDSVSLVTYSYNSLG